MKRGLLAVIAFLFILIAVNGIYAATCVQGGYMDPLDCRMDDYSCQYAHRCDYQGAGTCLGPECSVANFDEYSCKATCSLVNGVSVCNNCVYDYATGLCNNAGPCEGYRGSFCLPGLRKCSDNFALRQFCNGEYWETEQNCSATNMGICSANYNFETLAIETSCINCDLDGDGYLVFREFASACPSCAGTDCDCDDNNPAVHPGAIENCTNLIDDNCNGLIDGADSGCGASPVPPTCNDTDGYNIYLKGFVINDTNAFVDSCLITGQLTEYLCSNGSIVTAIVSCPANFTCFDGACISLIPDNQTNVTNCTPEGGFASELLPCCPGLSGFTIPDPETDFCPVTSSSRWSFFRAFLGMAPMTGKTVYTEQAICYNASKGNPVCQNAGNETEGWYYNITGELLKLGTCSSLCIDSMCDIGGVNCANCRSGFRLFIDAARASRQSAPESVKEKNASQIAAELIKQFEGFRSERYNCAAGKPTIGYGHVITSRSETFEGVNLWTGTLTKEQATRLLLQDAKKIAESAIKSNVKVDLTQNQYDALTSFIFNVGGSNFRRSTLLKHLNTGDYQKAANELPKWNKGGGKVLKGLERRRAAEKELFETPAPPEPTVELILLNDDNMIAFNGTHMVIFIYNTTDAVFLDFIKPFAIPPYNKVVLVSYSESDWNSFLETIETDWIKDKSKIYNEELKAFIEAENEPVPPTPPEEDEGVG